MSNPAAKLCVAAATIALGLTASTASFARGGGFQWNPSAPTTEVATPTETSGPVHAASLNNYGPGETRPGVVAQHDPGHIIAMGASCYYLVQNGTWSPSGNTAVN